MVDQRQPVISLIVAMSENRVIGVNGTMPWHISADLRYFREITWGKPIIMGRKTFAALGKPLPGRRNIIISQTPGYQPAGCDVVSSPAAALALANAEEIMVIGGGKVYEAFLPHAQRLYITLIHREFTGDTWFPAWQASDWQEEYCQRVEFDPACELSYSFLRYQRKPGLCRRAIA